MNALAFNVNFFLPKVFIHSDHECSYGVVFLCICSVIKCDVDIQRMLPRFYFVFFVDFEGVIKLNSFHISHGNFI